MHITYSLEIHLLEKCNILNKSSNTIISIVLTNSKNKTNYKFGYIPHMKLMKGQENSLIHV